MQIQVGGQFAWFHDNGDTYGYYHTFDNLCFDGRHSRKVHVLLPRSYRLQPDARFPVIYMNDGHSAFWPAGYGDKSLSVTQRLSELHESRKIRRVIVVAIHTINRDREYSHTAWEIMREFGDVDKYSRYLALELKPFIDAHYRTVPTPKANAIVGSDLGGLASIITGCTFPEAFGVVAASSPLIWAGLDDLYNLYPIVETLSSSQLFRLISPGLKDPETRPQIWIDWGLVRVGGPHNSLIEEAVTIRSKEFVDLLQRKFGYKDKVDLFSFEDTVGGHDELAWSYRFTLFAQIFFPFNEAERKGEEEALETEQKRMKALEEARNKKRAAINASDASTATTASKTDPTDKLADDLKQVKLS